MSNLLVHNMGTAWTSSAPSLLQVAADAATFVEGAASNRLTAQAGAQNALAEYVPAAPLDLNDFEELRFWVRCDRPAAGSADSPFLLEFSYLDGQDAAGEEHRWFVPVNQAGRWEQRRVGIQNDRRGQVRRFRFRALTNRPFVCHLDELLAVREELVADVEQALALRLDAQVSLPALTDVPLSQTANPSASQVIVPLNQEFAVGNRLRVRGGTAGEEFHQVTGVNHSASTARTTLDFSPGDKIRGTLSAGVATVSVVVPLIFEAPPAPRPAITPAVFATMLDAREDFERSSGMTQRDSFRPRGAATVCSVRPAARAYVLDYQFTAVAPGRAQQVAVQTMLWQRLSADLPLRVNGYPSPVWVLQSPPPGREMGLLAPVYVRIGTRMEIAPRQESPWVRQVEVGAAQADAPPDQEKVVITL